MTTPTITQIKEILEKKRKAQRGPSIYIDHFSDLPVLTHKYQSMDPAVVKSIMQAYNNYGRPRPRDEVIQIEGLKFHVGASVHHSIWEWLINSPYEVKMTSQTQIEFLDPAGAVAFKLMFVKGPRDGTNSDNAT